MTVHPLTFGQLSVWRIMERHALERWPESYLRQTVPVPHGVPVDRVIESIGVLRARHTSLRTHFVDTAGGPVQRVMPASEPVDVEIVHRDSADQRTAAAVSEELAGTRIDREVEFGGRFAVVTSAGRAAHVAVVVDHIVADGYGLSRIRAELTALLGGHDPDGVRWLAEDPPQPGALAEEQRSEAARPRHESVVGYWRQLLHMLPAEIFPVPWSAGESPGRVESILRSPQAPSSLAVLSAMTNVSPQNVLLALSTLATAAVTGGRRIVMTLQAGNRFSPRWRSIVSSMNQYAPLAVDIGDAEVGFAAFATGVQLGALNAYRKGSYDIDVITELVRRERGIDLGYDHFYNFMAHGVTPSAGPPAAAFTPGQVLETQPYRQIGPRFDIKIRGGSDLPIVVRADPLLLPRPAVRGLLGWFDEQLHRLAHSPDTTVGELLARCASAIGKRVAA